MGIVADCKENFRGVIESNPDASLLKKLGLTIVAVAWAQDERFDRSTAEELAAMNEQYVRETGVNV
jgi:hypothetical protein